MHNVCRAQSSSWGYMQVEWDDIGGLDKLKKQLQDIVTHIKMDPDAPQTAVSRAQPRGVLLFGPPGCSKTMLARAMATQGGLNFLHIRGTDIYSKYVGESEKAISRAFARACLLYTSPSPRDATLSRMPSSA